MAFAFVQELASGVRTTSGVNTIVLTPAANASAGDLLVLGCQSGSSQTITSVTDTKSNTWTLGPNPAASNVNAQAAYTLQDGGTLTTSDTITVTFSTTSANKVAVILEFSGATAATLDVTGTGTRTTPSVATSGAITNANDLVVGIFCWKDTALQETFTAGAGYTLGGEQDENFAANLGVAVEYQVLSGHSLSAVTATGTMSATPGSGSQIVLTFKPGTADANVNLPTAIATASATPPTPVTSGQGIQFVRTLARPPVDAASLGTGTFSPAHDADPGDWLVLATNHGITSVTDTKSNTWTVGPDPGGSGQNAITAWTAQDGGTLTTSDVVTITYVFTEASRSVLCLEFSNVNLSGQPDASNTMTTTGVTSLSITTSSAITNANDLLLGVFAWRGTAQLTLTPDAGWSNVEIDQNSGIFAGLAMAFQIGQGASLTTKTAHGALSGTSGSASATVLAITPVSTAVNVNLPTAVATASGSPLIIDPTSGDWANIGGATSANYVPVSGDAGEQLRCLVTGSNTALGSGSGVASVATDGSLAVSSAKTGPTTGAPTVDDTTPQIGQVINALSNANTWNGTPPLTFGYQWQRSGATTTITSQVFVCLDGEIHVYDPQNNWTQTASYTGLATSDGVRGVTADPNAGTAGRIYIGHGSDGQVAGNGSLMCWDIATHSVVYDVAYTHGVDQIGITTDGTQVWIPDGEGQSSSTSWFVKTASTGAAVATINVSGASGPHNTAFGLKTGNAYLGSRHAAQIAIYTQARTLVRAINIGNPGGATSGNVGARPYTFDSNETLLFVTHSAFLGFTVIDISTGTTILTVDFTQAANGGYPFNQSTSNFTTPAHGISMSPDETQLAVIDVFNSRVHFYDITGTMANRTAPIHLSSPFIDGATSNTQFTGNQTPCAYDCQRYGWLTHSWDGQYLYVQDTADVFDTQTRQRVGTISTMRNTRHGLIGMTSVNGVATFTPTHFGLGRKSFGQIPQSSTGWANASGIGNATSAYTVPSADLGLMLRCAVTGTNSVSSATVDTPATSPVASDSPPTTGSPTVDDTTPSVGQTITALANANTWDGTPPLSFTYQWQHLPATGIWTGATGTGNATQAYVVDTTDAGLALRCALTASNSIGTSGPALTPATAAVADQLSPPANTTPPSLLLSEAIPVVGDILVCDGGVWTGNPVPALTFQWQHSPDGTTFNNCAGAGSDTAVYAVDTSDVGLELACLVTATNSVGTRTFLTSTTPSTVAPTQTTASTLVDIFLDTTSVPQPVASSAIDIFLSTSQPPTPTGQQGADSVLVNLSTPVLPGGGGNGGGPGENIIAQRPRFLRHCGIEVTNMARTVNYLRNGLAGPLFDVSSGDPCAVLYREASATVFNSPAQDPAPWYDPNRPESAKFLGVILQDLEVLDSTKVRSATNVLGRLGGAVFSSSRRTGRMIYGTGSIFAQDAEGSDYGLQWLKAVLEGSACDDCETCVSEVRLTCPPDDGSDDTRGWWRLYNTVLVDGPKKSQTYDYDCAYLLDIEFTLEAGNPYLFKQVNECLSRTELMSDPGPQSCIPFDQWLCGPGSAVQCCTINPPTEVGTVCGIVTIQSQLGVGGILLASYNDCPPVLGITQPVTQMVIPSLPAGSSLIIDSGLHQVSYVAPNGKITDGTPYISLPAGTSTGWVEVSSCDPATCLCVQTLHPCSGGVETFVTVQTVYREG